MNIREELSMKFENPERITEANIQAEFYHQCRLKGVECYLEYKHEQSRFDAIIIKNNDVVLIVEFKSYKTDKKGKTKTKQLDKYRQYGIPVLLITRMNQIEQVIASLSFKIGVAPMRSCAQLTLSS
jgi:DNA-binding MurR/RpiR family transcriptional regulator